MRDIDEALRRAAEGARAGTPNGALILTAAQRAALALSGVTHHGTERGRSAVVDDVPTFHGVEFLEEVADRLGPCPLCGTHHPPMLCPHGREGA